MSGARLETVGQVRNAYPHIVSVGKRITLTIPVAAFNAVYEDDIQIDRSLIPYDVGPDKSGRVFVCINGIAITIRADVGTTSVASGFIYYRSAEARKVYLAAIGELIANGKAVNVPLAVSPSLPIVADSVDNIGYIGFENIASAAGTATNIILDIAVNIGLYGDYAEPQWRELFKSSMHEHIGLSIFREENDSN